MEQPFTLLQDMAVIMVVAGIVTGLFHLMRQPLILGYLIAGMIAGPHTPPFSYVQDLDAINFMADLGVVLLLFAVGLEFPLRRLLQVGQVAFLAGALKVFIPWAIGYQVGIWMGLTPIEALFLGAIISITSTAVVVKALQDLRQANTPHAGIIYGTSVIDDFLAVGIIVVLGSLATGAADVGSVFALVGKLGLFIVASVLLGITVIPWLIDYLVRLHRRETLLVVVLGLCFGFALITQLMGLAAATGAFVMGAIMGESRHRERLVTMTGPLRDMFAAMFFVAVGMLIDLSLLPPYLPLILAITGVAIVGKVLGAALGTFISGYGGQTAFRVGMALAAIGEFSFIMAKIGQDTDLVRDFLYPVAMGSAIITIFATPFMIRGAPKVEGCLVKLAPGPIRRYVEALSYWFVQVRVAAEGQGAFARAAREALARVVINLILIGAVMVGGRLVLQWMQASNGSPWLHDLADNNDFLRLLLASLVPVMVAFLSAPSVVVIWRALSSFTERAYEILRKDYPASFSPGFMAVRFLLMYSMLAVVFVLVAVLALPMVDVALELAELWPLPFILLAPFVATGVYLWRRLQVTHARLEVLLHEALGGTQHLPAEGADDDDDPPAEEQRR